MEIVRCGGSVSGYVEPFCRVVRGCYFQVIKLKMRPLFIFSLLFLLLTEHGFAQGMFVRKIDLYIIPISFRCKRSVKPNEVRKIATLKMSIKTAHGTIENIDFLDLVKGLNDTSCVKIIKDYRIVCVVRKFIGKEVLYFNTFGGFLYKGKTYEDERIKSYIFSHLPDYCK